MLFTIVPHAQHGERNSAESVPTVYSPLLDKLFFAAFYLSFGIGFRVLLPTQ